MLLYPYTHEHSHHLGGVNQEPRGRGGSQHGAEHGPKQGQEEQRGDHAQASVIAEPERRQGTLCFV